MNFFLDQEKNEITPVVKLLQLNSFDEKVEKKSKRKRRHLTFLGITGGQGSGKTKIAEYFKSNVPDCEILSERSFFHTCKTPRKISKDVEFIFSDFPDYSKERRLYLIDSSDPNCYDLNQLYETLNRLKNREKVKVPYFDEDRMKYIKTKDYIIDPEKTPIIIVEGYFIFTEQKILDLLGLKLFRDVQDDIRLTRLILSEEKYLKNNIKSYQLFFGIYKYFMKDVYNKIIEKFKKPSNMVLPNYSINEKNELEEDEALEILKNDLIRISKI